MSSMENDINGTLEGGNIQEYCNLGKTFKSENLCSKKSQKLIDDL